MSMYGPVPACVIVCPVCAAPNPPAHPEEAGWRRVPYAWVCSDVCEAAYQRVLDKIPVADGFRAARGCMPPWPGDPSPEEAIRTARDAWSDLDADVDALKMQIDRLNVRIGRLSCGRRVAVGMGR